MHLALTILEIEALQRRLRLSWVFKSTLPFKSSVALGPGNRSFPPSQGLACTRISLQTWQNPIKNTLSSLL